MDLNRKVDSNDKTMEGGLEGLHVLVLHLDQVMMF